MRDIFKLNVTEKCTNSNVQSDGYIILSAIFAVTTKTNKHVHKNACVTATNIAGLLVDVSTKDHQGNWRRLLEPEIGRPL